MATGMATEVGNHIGENGSTGRLVAIWGHIKLVTRQTFNSKRRAGLQSNSLDPGKMPNAEEGN